jgi:isoleucyl-tRNA synthetase
MDADKRAAYETLYECLVTLAATMAPFTPYQSEAMYRNLVVKGLAGAAAGKGRAESVHLTSFPEPNLALIDKTLSHTLTAVRDVVSLGLQVRTQGKLKVRQPLSVAKVILADPLLADRLAPYVEMMKDELNVLAVELVTKGADEYVTYRVKPNFRTLGQKGMGAQAQQLKKHMSTMSAADAQALVAAVLASGKATVDGIEIEQADLEVAFDAKEGYAAAGERIGVVVLDTRLDDALRDLGYLRELLNRVQNARKELGLDFVDRIRVRLAGSDRAMRIGSTHEATIKSECLAVDLAVGAPDASSTTPSREVDVEGDKVEIWITKA